MPVFALTEKLEFPHPSLADEESGLLAIGGDLSAERILLAYENGIFPWYSEGMPICWYATNPRFVLFPDQLHISKSLAKKWKSANYRITVNEAFSAVLTNCQSISRIDQAGTWITNDMKIAYAQLHNLGYAKSIEVWQGDDLVGGLYGLQLNDCFFGESMFHKVPDASKLALIHLCQNMNLRLIDCQTHTNHLERMGAEMISLEEFLELIRNEK